MTPPNAAAVPRKEIPREMWDQIRSEEHRHHEETRRTTVQSDLSMRAALIVIGQRHGFTESEMESRGLIEKLSRAQQYFQATT